MSVDSNTNLIRVQDDHGFVKLWSEWSGRCRAIQIETGYFYFGILLLLAFGIQYAFDLKWNWLADMQTNETFRQGTGLVLASFVVYQWVLFFLRTKGRIQASRSYYLRHKRIGVLAPLVFYFHSMQLGYAYLFLLSGVFFANVVLGIFNQERVRIRKRWFVNWWIFVHVSLSVILVCLLSIHIIIALIYE